MPAAIGRLREIQYRACRVQIRPYLPVRAGRAAIISMTLFRGVIADLLRQES